MALNVDELVGLRVGDVVTMKDGRRMVVRGLRDYNRVIEAVELCSTRDVESVLARHASGCATHNAPAYEAGACDCKED